MTAKHCASVIIFNSKFKYLSLQGKVYTVGQGDTGQLGLGDAMVSKTPTCIPFPYDEYNIVSIAAGIAHNSECLLSHRRCL